jgi:hypothetical protein
MNYNDFLDKIRPLVDISPYEEKLWYWPDGNKKGSKKASQFDYIRNKVEIGGKEGGDCWGGEPEHYTRNEEQEFKDLMKILESIAPKITFLQYKKLAKLIYSYERIEYEYYGNYTEYRIEYIKLEELFEFFTQNNLIED